MNLKRIFFIRRLINFLRKDIKVYVFSPSKVDKGNKDIDDGVISVESIDRLIERAKSLKPVDRVTIKQDDPYPDIILLEERQKIEIWKWYNRPKWVWCITGQRAMICNVRALSFAWGKDLARKAVMEAEKNDKRRSVHR